MSKRFIAIISTTVLVALLPVMVSLLGGKNFESNTYAETVSFYHSTSVDCNDHS